MEPILPASDLQPTSSARPRRARSGTIAAQPPTSATAPHPLPVTVPPTRATSSRCGTMGDMYGSDAAQAAQAAQPSRVRVDEAWASEHEGVVQSPSQHGTDVHDRTVTLQERVHDSGRRFGPRVDGRKRKRWLVHVIPPDILPHDPPPAATSGFANGYGASGRFGGGILMLLQPTLSAQVSLIAREYGLPSVAGICLYLALEPTPTAPAPYDPSAIGHPFESLALSTAVPKTAKPRVTEETWPALWSAFFDDEDASAQAMLGVGSLPLVGRIEFDFDPGRARWLHEWRALPPATNESFTPAPPLSPAFSLRFDRPRFGTSLPYVRPVTPAASDGHLQPTDHEDLNSNASSVLGSDLDGLSAPVTPRMSTPRTSFESHRPLSLLNYASSFSSGSQSRSASVTSARSSALEATAEENPIPETMPTQPSALPTRLVKPIYNDSGFGEGTASPAAARPSVVAPPVPSPITLTSAGSTFAFPRPPPPAPLASPSLPAPFVPPAQLATSPVSAPFAETDWTTQLDRLREISETSLLHGVDHPSQYGSVDASASEALDELLLSIVSEAAPVPAKYEEHYQSGLYPPRGIYGLEQPRVALPTGLEPSKLSALQAGDAIQLAEPVDLSALVNRAPVLAGGTSDPQPVHPRTIISSRSSASAYPFLVIYPSAYPYLDLYPPAAATSPIALPTLAGSLAPPAAFAAPAQDTFDPPERASAEELIDDDPFAAAFSHDSPASPPTDGDDETETFLESYAFDGRPLSSITEVTETELTSAGSASTWSGQTTPVDADDHEAETAYLGGVFGELQLDEGEEAQWACEPVALPEISLSASTGPPRFIYSSPTGSLAPSHEPAHFGLPQSPLPSPTITPASAFAASQPVLPLVPLPLSHFDDCGDETRSTAQEDDYTLEGTETLSSTLDYSGSYDAPYIVSPGLQAALGLDDSPELVPVQFDDDDELDAQLDSEDSQSDDGSQYSGRESDFQGERAMERDLGDECRTLDHFMPPHDGPVLPVLFAFAPLSDSRDLLDALALFIVEAQVQSVERRGRFTVALGGDGLPEWLPQALLDDERIEWDKWEIFFARESLSHDVLLPQRFIDQLFSRVPVCSGKVHVFRSGAAAVTAEEYEEQLARVFETGEDEVPCFDLILLGADELDIVATRTFDVASSSSSRAWVAHLAKDDPDARSDVRLAPALLSSARRLAYLLPTPSSRPGLAALLAANPPGHIQLASRQPVVLFADEDAARGLQWERARFWDADGAEGEM